MSKQLALALSSPAEHGDFVHEVRRHTVLIWEAQAASKKLKSQKLPLILDDPLTQSDTNRRDGLWRVLRQASQFLQIVFVTCHETHLPENTGANFVTLGEWKQATNTLVATVTVVEETPKRTKKIKPETNGHTDEKATSESLALW